MRGITVLFPCVAVALAVVVTEGCGGDAATGAGPVHVDDLPHLSWSEELRVGSLDDPVAGFSRIGAVDVSSTGEVYVLESQAREVRVFDGEGRYLRTIGGPGEGPGEFIRPSRIGLLGDTLWVSDMIARRISWFNARGELLFETPGGGFRYDPGVEGVMVQVMPAMPRDDGLVESSALVSLFLGSMSEPYRIPTVLFDRQGEVVDTLGWRVNEAGETVRVGEGQLSVPTFSPQSPVRRLLGRDSVVLTWAVPGEGSGGELRVTRAAPGGDTVYDRTLGYEALPLPGRAVDSLLEARASEGLARAFGVDQAELARALRSAFDPPAHRSPIRGTFSGSDGTLWIELNTTAPDSADWILVEPDGTPGGRLTLPHRMEPEYADGSDVWAVELDGLDVPWLVRLRVVGG